LNHIRMEANPVIRQLTVVLLRTCCWVLCLQRSPSSRPCQPSASLLSPVGHRPQSQLCQLPLTGITQRLRHTITPPQGNSPPLSCSLRRCRETPNSHDLMMEALQWKLQSSSSSRALQGHPAMEQYKGLTSLQQSTSSCIPLVCVTLQPLKVRAKPACKPGSLCRSHGIARMGAAVIL
jgi:hypothetical protein